MELVEQLVVVVDDFILTFFHLHPQMFLKSTELSELRHKCVALLSLTSSHRDSIAALKFNFTCHEQTAPGSSLRRMKSQTNQRCSARGDRTAAVAQLTCRPLAAFLLQASSPPSSLSQS